MSLLNIEIKEQQSFLFFQAEDGIRDLVRSRGLGDVYKRQIRDGEILLLNVHISPHKNVGSFFNHDPLRNRKLLLHKKEIRKLKSNIEKKGMTIVPLSLYLKGSWIKLTIGVGKGKKLHDKRQDEKQKSVKKEINSALKR